MDVNVTVQGVAPYTLVISIVPARVRQGGTVSFNLSLFSAYSKAVTLTDNIATALGDDITNVVYYFSKQYNSRQ